ncbi:carbohydrate binding domain-containing protein [Aeromonas veronii]|uniref:carbohydrate binding domain-containing protein n=1 Tax=Aeromonas veronii TaxID=654 RepID=UPI003DA4ADA9
MGTSREPMDGGRPGGTLNAENQMGCITFTESGSNPWDVILGQSNLGLVQGQTYKLHFTAMAKSDINVKALIQHDGAPLHQLHGAGPRPRQHAQTVRYPVHTFCH